MCCVYVASSNVCLGICLFLSIRSCFCLSFSRSLSACLETHSAILKDTKIKEKIPLANDHEKHLLQVQAKGRVKILKNPIQIPEKKQIPQK